MNQPFFLQSSEWEEFQKTMHRRTWRVESALVVRHKIGRGGFNYLYVGKPKLPENVEVFVNEIKKIADAEKSLFTRIDRAERSDALPPHDPLLARGRIGRSMQPQRTIMLDLSKTPEQLLGAMHEKTRYNIRLSEKKGVQIKKVLRRNAKEDFAIFWDLLTQTAKRDRFHTHSRAHYEELVETRSEQFSNELFFAEHEGKVIAAAMINFYHPVLGVPGVATYLHGASSAEARSVMAPYALHWHIVGEAKARGFGHYDFWGIDERKLPGVTRFKRGFGGDEVLYAPTVEIVYRPFLTGLYGVAKWFR